MTMPSSTPSSTVAGRPLIAADRVAGTNVYDTEGKHIGDVYDVMIDKVSGQVAYAILSFGGFLGIGEKYYPVPWNLLEYNTTLGGYVVPLDKDRLEAAPTYEVDTAGDLENADYGQRIHDYYGTKPYWMM